MPGNKIENEHSFLFLEQTQKVTKCLFDFCHVSSHLSGRTQMIIKGPLSFFPAVFAFLNLVMCVCALSDVPKNFV